MNQIIFIASAVLFVIGIFLLFKNGLGDSLQLSEEALDAGSQNQGSKILASPFTAFVCLFISFCGFFASLALSITHEGVQGIDSVF